MGKLSQLDMQAFKYVSDHKEIDFYRNWSRSGTAFKAEASNLPVVQLFIETAFCVEFVPCIEWQL
jgi:hypothetical protein